MRKDAGTGARPGARSLRPVGAILVLSVALCLVPGDTAQARQPAVCAKKAGKTLLATRDARVFKRSGQFYACLRRARRAFRLGGRGGDFGDDAIGNLALRGRFVAYSLHKSSGRTVRVKELRRGRMIHDVDAGSVGPFDFLTDIRLARNGSVAWIVTAQPIDVPMNPNATPIDYLPFYEVRKADRAGHTLLDGGRDVAPGSLRLRGTLVYWRRAGRIRTALLN